MHIKLPSKLDKAYVSIKSVKGDVLHVDAFLPIYHVIRSGGVGKYRIRQLDPTSVEQYNARKIKDEAMRFAVNSTANRIHNDIDNLYQESTSGYNILPVDVFPMMSLSTYALFDLWTTHDKFSDMLASMDKHYGMGPADNESMYRQFTSQMAKPEVSK